MTDSLRGTLKSIMIVDNHGPVLYSLVELFEGENSAVHSVVSVERTVQALEDDFAAAKRIGLSAEEMGDILMNLIPDTDTLSRFRTQWNPFVLKLRMYVDADSNDKRSQDLRMLVEPSVRDCAPNKDADAHSATSNEPKEGGEQ